ncbi:MAG: SRPBCC family protein [Chloroflexota bacterium]
MTQEIGTIQRQSFNYWTMHTEIEIDAPAEKIWQVLTGFESMSSWSNTFPERGPAHPQYRLGLA